MPLCVGVPVARGVRVERAGRVPVAVAVRVPVGASVGLSAARATALSTHVQTPTVRDSRTVAPVTGNHACPFGTGSAGAHVAEGGPGCDAAGCGAHARPITAKTTAPAQRIRSAERLGRVTISPAGYLPRL